MELAAVFLLSLLGGYTFALIWRYTAFETRRAEGHHLYFKSAYYGAVLFTVAFLIRVILISKIPTYREFEKPLLDYITGVLKDPNKPKQAEVVVVAGYSMFMGPILGTLANSLTPRLWNHRRNLNALDDLLFRGQSGDMPVSLTLTNGKIYIGLVVRITDPERPPPMVTPLPVYTKFASSARRPSLPTRYDSQSDPKPAGPTFSASRRR